MKRPPNNGYDDQGWLFGDEARRKRDEGIDKVLGNAVVWFDRAYHAAEAFVATQDATFTGEDIRFACRDIVGEPHHPNAWGGLTNTLVRRKAMIATGQYQQPKDSTSHARAIQVYVRL